MSEQAKSVPFDRAASFYDQTRTLSPDAAKRVTELLSDELAGVERALEIGVGTGRIALPLVDAGVRLVGVDLSAPMLARWTTISDSGKFSVLARELLSENGALLVAQTPSRPSSWIIMAKALGSR